MWEEAASEFMSLPPPHTTHEDAGTDSYRGVLVFSFPFPPGVEVEVTRGEGNTKGNPHLHLETKKTTKKKPPETQDVNMLF